ncbi:hypothetical protein PR048_017346 [Dryococelus australis]|uniref:Uncharacterized protein n=1 Tax=Dryococelus australis TaxID=614101 RepID=A0ABQ9H9B1_9NEOP|nr:hypothetical protein PR048_017346 [Dryococelus australis]
MRCCLAIACVRVKLLQAECVLQLTHTFSSLVWSTSTEEARHLLALPQDSFVDAVNEALWKQYPRSNIVVAATQGLDKLLSSVLFVSAVNRQLQPSIADIEEGSRAAFPLGFGHATRYVAPSVALVGYVSVILIHLIYWLWL